MKRKTKNIKVFNLFCICFFVTALLVRVVASIILSPVINDTKIRINENEERMAALREENEQLRNDIKVLQGKDRVYTIAMEAGLEQKNNLIFVTDNQEKD